MDYYYSIEEDEQVGPVSEEIISNLFIENNINEDTLVWCCDMDDWSSLKDAPIWFSLKNKENSCPVEVPNLSTINPQISTSTSIFNQTEIKETPQQLKSESVIQPIPIEPTIDIAKPSKPSKTLTQNSDSSINDIKPLSIPIPISPVVFVNTPFIPPPNSAPPPPPPPPSSSINTSSSTTNDQENSELEASPDDANVVTAQPDRYSRRLTFRDQHLLKKTLLSNNPTTPINPNKPTVPLTAKAALKLDINQPSDPIKVEKVRRASALALAVNEPTVSGCMSIGQMNAQGGITKTGWLYKQSKFLGRWKKRFVALENDTLTYYDKMQDYNSNKASSGKTLKLSPEACVTYASKDFCFAVKPNSNSTGASGSVDVRRRLSMGFGFTDNNEWFLMTEKDSDKYVDDWIRAISSHIHKVFIDARGVTTDFWEAGPIVTSFWKVPEATASSPRNPVGIRTLPFTDAPRTNEGIYPGEVVEIVQIYKSDNNIFLRLADDRGWVFQYHPKARYVLLMNVPGEYIEEERRYIYASNRTDDLNTFIGPSFDSEITGNVITPGGILTTSAVFTADFDLTAAGGLVQEEVQTQAPRITFAKLVKDKSWVACTDVDTGEALLEMI